MANDRLEQLLDIWMSDRDRGVTRTAVELCAESPELAEELSRRIQVVKKFEQLADVGQSETLVSQGEVDTSHSTNAPAPASMKKAPLPASIGNFKPLEVLGEGGMGAVYLAEDPQLGRRVAVKVMKKELAADPDAKRRFLREARAMATIEHDNIMTIYAVGEDQGTPYLVMPVLKGETLDDRLRRETRLSVAETRRIGQEIAAGLEAAHSHGLIHRDIKPSNIWLEGKQGRVRILDFGLARPASDDQKVTHSGAVLGTPAYMAPEQAAGMEATPRSDLFSLGAVLYRMTTGHQPFAGPNMMATLNNLANKHPEFPHKICPEVPESLSEVIQQLIAKPPEHRPESASVVLESLQQTMETLVPQITIKPSPATTREKNASRPAAEASVNGASSNTRPPRALRKVLAGGFAGLLVLMSFIVYRIQTDKGVLIVSIDDEQVAAKLTKGGLEIEDAKTGRTWTIKPDQPESVSAGEYKITPPNGLLLHVTDDTGTEFTTAEFKIKRGDQITVRVTLAGEETSSVVVASGWHGWPADAPSPAIAPFNAHQALQHQEAWSRYLNVPVQYTNSIGMKFRLIPPGEFKMGSTKEEIEEALKLETAHSGEQRWLDCINSEAPQHTVILPQPIYLGVNEVTQAEYEKVMGVNPSQFAPNGPGKDSVTGIETFAHPVDSVSWNDACEFCAKLSKQEELKPFSFRLGEAETALDGTGYRLPREAEWENACRAGTTTNYWLGEQDEDLVGAGWFADNSGGRTHAAGELKANPYGLYDIHGNVFEWVEDWWEPTYYRQFQERPAVNPSGPSVGSSQRVIRGGGWAYGAYQCRASDRRAHIPDYGHNSFGFRASLTVHAVRTSLKLTGPAIPKSQSMELSSAKPAPETSRSKSAVPASEWNGWPKDAPAPAIAPFDAVHAKRHQEEWAKHLGVPVEYTNSIGMKFVLIPPGEFLMGSMPEDVAREIPFVNKDDARWMECLQTESPQHRVVLSDAIYVAVNEVTTQQFLTLSSETNSKPNSGKDDHPVIWVTHNAVEDYCRLLNEHESVPSAPPNSASLPVVQVGRRGYRLLTEAEWEFACRAGTLTRFWSGADETSMEEAAWFADNSAGSPHPVGTRKPNAFGLHDMLGNAWEWCADEWSPAYYAELSKQTAVNPAGPQLNKSVYVARGGDWHDVAAACRSAFRYGYPVSFRSSGMGFRIAVPWRTIHELTTRSAKDQHTGSSASEMKNKMIEASPPSVLDGTQIPAEERTPELPPETVAVLGSSHGKTWGSVYFTTHGNLTYSPDGKWIAACDLSNAYLFDAKTLDLRKRFPLAGHFLCSRWTTFSADSRQLHVALNNSTGIHRNTVTDLTTADLKTSIAFEDIPSVVVAISPDNQWIATEMPSNSNNVQLRHLDLATGGVSEKQQIPDVEGLPRTSTLGRVVELAFSPDGEWLISGHSTGSSGGYSIFRKQNGNFVHVAVIPANINQYNVRVAYSFTEDRKVALLDGADVVQQVDLSLPMSLPLPSDGLPVSKVEALTGVHDISVSADGLTWAASKNSFPTPSGVLVGTWQDGIPVLQHTIPMHATAVGHVALSPGGDSLAVMAEQRIIGIYDLTQSTPVATAVAEYSYSAVSPTAGNAVTVSMSGTIKLERFSKKSAELLDTQTTEHPMVHVCISIDGRRAVSFSPPNAEIGGQTRIQVWDIADDKLVAGPYFNGSADQAYAWPFLMENGSRLLYGNGVWNLESTPPKLLHTFSGMPAKPSAAAVSQDNHTVALVDSNGILSLFKLTQSTEVPIASAQLPPEVTSIAFSPDGCHLVTTHRGAMGVVWELKGNQIAEQARMPEFYFDGFGGMYYTTATIFSGDGRAVFVGGQNGVVEWKLDDNSIGRHWSLPGFTWLSRSTDGRHLIFNNSNTTTWILRLAP